MSTSTAAAKRPYLLIGKIHAHEGPIRSMSRGPLPNEILTGSQDSTVRRWLLADVGTGVWDAEQLGAPLQHDHWVTALTSLPASDSAEGGGEAQNKRPRTAAGTSSEPGPCALFPSGLIVTGCMDGAIRLYDGAIGGGLVATLVGHSKGIISFSWLPAVGGGAPLLVSGSWDGTARVWGDDGGGFGCMKVLEGHENGVHVLGVGVGGGVVVTTSTGESVNSKPANFQVRFWSVATGEELLDVSTGQPMRLADHEGPIRSIQPTALPGHPSGTCVATDPDSGVCSAAFLTTSNDGTIKAHVLQLLSGGDGEGEGATLLSVDCVCNAFHPCAQTSGDEEAFPPFILDAASIAPAAAAAGVQSAFVSCGEDGSVLVWNRDSAHSGSSADVSRGGAGTTGCSLAQVLNHPCGVWSVLDASPRCRPAATDGDAGSDGAKFVSCTSCFGTAGHDGILRLFADATGSAVDRDAAAVGSALAAIMALQSDFDAEVAASAAKREGGPSAEEIAKAPCWEDRGEARHAGRSDQQVCVFSKPVEAPAGAAGGGGGRYLIAAQWSAPSRCWVEIGEVTGSAGGGGGGAKRSVNGVQYDHVMPVEIDSTRGMRTLQLGYNDGENPFGAAKRFVDENELDPYYVTQVADWILARGGGGGKRGGGGAPMFDLSTDNASNRDPAPPAAPAARAPAVSVHFAVRPSDPSSMVMFEDVSAKGLEKLPSKLASLNAEMGSPEAAGAGQVQLTEEELSSVSGLCGVLGETRYYHNPGAIAGDQLRPLQRMAEKWCAGGGDGASAAVLFCYARVFPLFDLARMLMLHASGVNALGGGSSSAGAGAAGGAALFRTLVLRACHVCMATAQLLAQEEGELGFTSAAATLFPSTLCALRFLANALAARHNHTRQLRDVVLGTIGQLPAFWTAVAGVCSNARVTATLRSAAVGMLGNVSMCCAMQAGGGAGAVLAAQCPAALSEALLRLLRVVADGAAGSMDAVSRLGVMLGVLYSFDGCRAQVAAAGNGQLGPLLSGLRAALEGAGAAELKAQCPCLPDLLVLLTGVAAK